MRRIANEIERDYNCPYGCEKAYGSEGAVNLHIKLKHNGGNKTEREKLAKKIVDCYINGNLREELGMLDFNLPPGTLQKALKKAGVSS